MEIKSILYALITYNLALIDQNSSICVQRLVKLKMDCK